MEAQDWLREADRCKWGEGGEGWGGSVVVQLLLGRPEALEFCKAMLKSAEA